MALNIHAIVTDAYALIAQARALFVAGRAADGQAEATAGGDDPVPGQLVSSGQLAQGAARPSARRGPVRRVRPNWP